jgi:pimeloyl-ACP methyl ester carboxylesterase
VIAEYVEIPGYQEPHTPPEFNNAYFMRYRYDTGAMEPPPVKAVIIDQPGGGSGHSAHSELASQIVDAGRGGIEFWVMSRRQAGLEDTLGLKMAAEAQNPALGHDYYFGPNAKFAPLQAGDIPFTAYWGLEVAMRDMECVLNLIPQDRQATNVFVGGHSLGGYLSVDFASYQFPDGAAGFEKIAGIVIIDGGPSIVDGGEAALTRWRTAVQDLTATRPPTLNEYNNLNTSGPLAHVEIMLQSMSGFWDPHVESPYKFSSRGGYRASPPVGGDEALEFLKHLRLTNEALVCMKLDDDGIPGSMCQEPYKHFQVIRCGRLDFPVLSKPGVPPLSSIDRQKVYGWLSGGAGEIGGETDDGPLNCYPTNQEAWWRHNPPNPNIVRSDVACLAGFFAGETTNIRRSVRHKFAVSGDVEIYRGNSARSLWYGEPRLLLDTIQAGEMSMPELNTTRKAEINVPVIAYGGDLASVPGLLPIFPQISMEEFSAKTKVSDWTQINADGVKYSASARERATFPTGTNSRLYNHGDYGHADNALAGRTPPGEVGAHVITNTVVPWILARVRGTTPVPTPGSLGF